MNRIYAAGMMLSLKQLSALDPSAWIAVGEACLTNVFLSLPSQFLLAFHGAEKESLPHILRSI